MWVGLKKDETENKWKGFKVIVQISLRLIILCKYNTICTFYNYFNTWKGDEKKDLSSHKAWAPGVPDNYNGIGENCGEIQNFGGDYLSDLGMQKPGIGKLILKNRYFDKYFLTVCLAFVPSWNDAHCKKRNFFICEASLEEGFENIQF